MTTAKLSISLCLYASIAISATAMAQIPSPGEAGPAGGNERRDAVMTVRPGSLLPVIDVFDDQGETISTASLRGNHNVLVFGCLT